MMRRAATILMITTALMLAAACGDDDDCVAVPAGDCAPLYQPTFDNVFANTLQPTCGAAGSACHAAEGAQGGLVFADIEDSYARLTTGGASARVLPGDAACSPLMARLAASDDARVMPPGQALSAQELCSISSWIANGAAR